MRRLPPVPDVTGGQGRAPRAWQRQYPDWTTLWKNRAILVGLTTCSRLLKGLSGCDSRTLACLDLGHCTRDRRIPAHQFQRPRGDRRGTACRRRPRIPGRGGNQHGAARRDAVLHSWSSTRSTSSNLLSQDRRVLGLILIATVPGVVVGIAIKSFAPECWRIRRWQAPCCWLPGRC
jgi:hypothetical protein